MSETTEAGTGKDTSSNEEFTDERRPEPSGGAVTRFRFVGVEPASGERLEDRARHLIARGTPENTKRAYKSDLRYIERWCRATGLPFELPMETATIIQFVVDHVEGLADPIERELRGEGFKKSAGRHSISTISRRVSALSSAHNSAGVFNPCEDKRLIRLLQKARSAAAREGWRPNKKTAAPLEILDKILETCGDTDIRDIRDRALLLFGWASGGRRRSEISQSTFDRLTRLGGEFVYALGVTKTTQDGEGATVPVAGRAATAMNRWLEVSKIQDGPLFRPISRHGAILPRAFAPQEISRIVKKRAKLAGFDPAVFGGHSLRSGFMTESGLQGVTLGEAMGLSGHKSVQVANGYHQAGAGLKNKAARLTG